MSKKSYTPNDQRSIAKNPTSRAYAADVANRARLGHAEVPAPPVVDDAAPAAPPTHGPPTPKK